MPGGYELVAPSVSDLEQFYSAYCRDQARDLIGMLPRDAVRPLYRRALAEHRETDDPLTALLSFCESILPLPPFAVWAEDALIHRAEHLADLDDSASAPTAAAPATIQALRFDANGERWLARLRAFRDDELWRGFILFEGVTTGAVHRTSLVFCERGAAELCERFLSFEVRTLEAFLRSALP
jgi:hypothetical protein